MRKPLGSHRFLHMVACNRCGRKEQWSPSGLVLIGDHITGCQPGLADDKGAPAARALSGEDAGNGHTQ